MHRRLEFSASTKREAFTRSRGVCECHLIPWLRRPNGCGVKLTAANGIFYEHINPDAIRSDASVDNCAVLSKTCWREKTSRHDIPTIAKSNRVMARHLNAWTLPRQVIPGSRASGWKHKMSGGWERRT